MSSRNAERNTSSAERGTEQILKFSAEHGTGTEHEFRGTRNGTEQIFKISAERGTGTELIFKISAERGTGTEHTGQNYTDPWLIEWYPINEFVSILSL